MHRSLRTPFLAAARHTGVLPLLAAAAVAAFLIPGAHEALQFDRAAVASGQLWRLLTCHWTHWTADHLLWDAITFAALGVMCERRSPPATLACLLLAALAIPAAIWLLHPGIPTYRGLSGLDSALFALLASLIARDAIARRDHPRLLLAFTAAALFTTKTAYELRTGSTLFVNTHAAGFQPLVLAHAVGAAAGAAIGLCAPSQQRRAVTPAPAPPHPPPPRPRPAAHSAAAT